MNSFANAVRPPQTSPPVSQSDAPAPQGTCRACGAPLNHTFVDLGMSPLCETYLRPAELNGMEPSTRCAYLFAIVASSFSSKNT